MPTNDKTVYESGADILQAGGATIPEDNEMIVPKTNSTTVLEETVVEATTCQGEVISNDAIEKGSLLMDVYRVDTKPIHGGMGSVWRVHHQKWDMDLAMKRPQDNLFTNMEQRANFIRECEEWIKLGLHPNIVSCYYVRELSGVPTIFSEWMENGSLENRIQDGSVYEGAEKEVQERLLDIAIQFARGLCYAHEAGIIHQDVKPDNLLLSRGWGAKVADFGLAKARAQLTVLGEAVTVVDGDSGTTTMATSGGYTPAYCSMEQMDGRLLTRRTDIYSWAVSVMEMYIGERPWINGVAAGLACREYFDMCRVRMPEGLKDLLEHCMEADPNQRPGDFEEIEDILLSIFYKKTGSKYYREKPQAADHTADNLSNQALSFLDLGKESVAESLWESALRKDPQSLFATYNQGLYLWRKAHITDEELLRRMNAADHTNKDREFADMMAWIALESGGMGHAKQYLDTSKNTVLQDLAGQAIESVEHLEFLEKCKGSKINAVFCPATEMVLLEEGSRYGEKTLTLCDPFGKKPEISLDVPQQIIRGSMLWEACFDATGQFVASALGQTSFGVWDLTNGCLLYNRAIPSPQGDSYSSPKLGISEDGRWLLAGRSGVYGTNEAVGIFDLSNGNLKRVFSICGSLHDLLFTPDQNMLLLTDEGGLTPINPHNGVRLPSFETRDETFVRANYSPDGKLLATVEINGMLHLYNAVSRKRIWRVDVDVHNNPSTSAPSLEPQFSHNGKWVVLHCAGSFNKLIEVETGRCRLTFPDQHGIDDSRVSFFLKDDQHLFTVIDETIRFENVPAFFASAPVMLSVIRDTDTTLDTERAYNQALENGRKALDKEDAKEALRCVERAYSLRAPDEQLRTLNRQAGMYSIPIGVRNLCETGRFPGATGLSCAHKETMPFGGNGAWFLKKTAAGEWKRLDSKTLEPIGVPLTTRISRQEISNVIGIHGKEIIIPDLASVRIEESALLSPDSRNVFFCDGRNIFKKDTFSGKLIGVFTNNLADRFEISEPIISPDGQILYCSTLKNRNELFAIDADSGDFLYTIGNPEVDNVVGNGGCKILNPDGRVLFYIPARGALYAYELPGGILRYCVSYDSGGYQIFALSPDGKYILALLADESAYDLICADSGDWLHRFLRDGKDFTHEIVFTPEGRFAITLEKQTIHFWDIEQGKHCFSKKRQEGRLATAAFAPDGRMLINSFDLGGLVYEIDYRYAI